MVGARSKGVSSDVAYQPVLEEEPDGRSAEASGGRGAAAPRSRKLSQRICSGLLLLAVRSWRPLLLLLLLLASVWALRAHGDAAVHLLSSSQGTPPQDPYDMEPGWSILEFWWAEVALAYLGPPLFFVTHRVLDPMCVLAALDVLFLTGAGFWLYRLSDSWLPENTRWKAEPLPDPATAADRSVYPRVVVQLPMYNEQQVYARCIAAACSLRWPREALLVQVLDDSTMEDVSAGMRAQVAKWQSRGVNVVYKKREDRSGFKAGNLREGLKEDYIQNYEYVAVLDADFQPASDWLLKTVHYLKEHAQLALVQTRWTFLNSQECDLTRYQEVELKWHFLTEQLTGAYFHDFFGFNGTAGVWRLAAIMEAGNWRDDTTVEDMDMAFCTTMLGWKFLFLPHVTCPSEVPGSLEAYRRQQHRWSSGPVDLAKKRLSAIWASKKMPLWHKLYVVLVFIGVRKALRSAVIFLSVGLVFPLGLLLPDSLVQFPPYGLIFHVLVYNLCLFVFSPGLIHLLPGYALFANTMALLRLRAIIAGLFDFSSIHEWVVTHKTGAALQRFGQYLASMTTGPDFGIKRSKSLPPNSPRPDPFSPFGRALFQSPRPDGQLSRFYPPPLRGVPMFRSLSNREKSPAGREREPAGGLSSGSGLKSHFLSIPEETKLIGPRVLNFDSVSGGSSLQEGRAEEGRTELQETAEQTSKKGLDDVFFTGWNGRMYATELMLGLVLFFSALLSIFYREKMTWLRVVITSWTFLQAAAFIQMGMGYIGIKE